jgi:dihydrofolate reductase
MKTILYMAITINGFIAKHDDSADFITPAESKSYVKAVKGAGALIVGRRTYEILSTQPEFQEFLKAGIKIIAVSKENFNVKDPNHVTAHSPKEALGIVKSFSKVIIAGGGKLDASFLNDNLIDEIYLDVEPAILGQGIPIFDGGEISKNLKFLGSKKFGVNEIQLHYKVLK